MSVAAILKEIDALTDDEYAELMTLLAERDAADDTHSITPEVQAELERRIAKADANPGANVPWEVVYAESLKRARQ